LAGAEAIITRNTKDFRRLSIKALDPGELDRDVQTYT